MCGRYTLRRLDLLRAAFDAQLAEAFEEISEHGKPLYNVAPSQFVPIVRNGDDGERVIDMAQWGLIPSWTKGKPTFKPIIARSETVATNGLFRRAYERRRCLIPADGFYEWQGQRPHRRPHFVHLKSDGLFAIAGVWERWRPDDGAEPVDTFSILTTVPNEVMRPIHDRMPVIVAQRDYQRWLDRRAKGADVADVLRPYDASAMEAWPVGTVVNSPKNDGPELVEPADA